LPELIACLWQSETHVLAEVVRHIYDKAHPLDPRKRATEKVAELILFNMSGDVPNEDWYAFTATNDISNWRPFGWQD
jgi:hypothetical protein